MQLEKNKHALERAVDDYSNSTGLSLPAHVAYPAPICPSYKGIDTDGCRQLLLRRFGEESVRCESDVAYNFVSVSDVPLGRMSGHTKHCNWSFKGNNLPGGELKEFKSADCISTPSVAGFGLVMNWSVLD